MTPKARRTVLMFCMLVAVTGQRGWAQSTAIPTPASVLGFPVGADFKLATYDDSYRYFQQLAKSSDMIKLVDVGKTSTGHDWILAIISSPANLARLDRYREIARRLAHPEGL